MLLRPRQRVFVERSVAALGAHDQTLAVAPTGAGKTIMLSSVVGKLLADRDAKACVLAHRDELTAQNRDKFQRVNPGMSTSVVDAREKSWAGRTVFAMVPTLARAANLDFIDEYHSWNSLSCSTRLSASACDCTGSSIIVYFDGRPTIVVTDLLTIEPR